MSPVAPGKRKKIDVPESRKVPSTKLNPGPEALTSIELPFRSFVIVRKN
jgi:hypothetical protein